MPKIIENRKEHIETLKESIKLCEDKPLKRLLQSQLSYHKKPRIESKAKRVQRIKQQINKYKALLTQPDISGKQKSNYETRLKMHESMLVVYE